MTNSVVEKNKLVQSKAWKEVCHSIAGPSVFCVNSAIKDGRNGPFMLYNTANATQTVRPIYRCIAQTRGMHFLSNDAKCEGEGTVEFILGYSSTKRGLETLRELFRCRNGDGSYTHALDLQCDRPETSVSLGYVR